MCMVMLIFDFFFKGLFNFEFYKIVCYFFVMLNNVFKGI